MRRTPITLAILAAVVTVAGSCGKSSEPVVAPTIAPAVVAAATPVLWRPTTHPGCFDPGDLLEVSVGGLTDPQGSVIATPARVAADGTVKAMLIAPVPVAYVDRAEAARRLADAYRQANIISSAVVGVRRLEVAGTGGSVAGPIGKYDLLRCTIGGLTTTAKPISIIGRVDGRGLMSVPLVAPVRLAGLTESDADAALAEAYRNANILSSAQVSVLVLERAPADAAHASLPDGPIDPVPEQLKELYRSQ